MNLDAMLRIKADVQGENNIRRLGNSLQGLQGKAKNAAMGFTSLKGAVAGFGAAIAGSAVVAGLSAIVKKSIDAGDELFNLQAKTGVAANSLIAIGNAAKLADVETAVLGKGLTKLNVNLVKAAEGNEQLASNFSRLGVDIKGTDGKVVTADKALKQIANRFADMPDGAQKAAAAVALFGKSGAELIPLLNEGAASMEKFTFKVGEDFAARSDLFNDTLTEFGIKTQGFGLELTDALLPALQSIVEVFGDLFDSEQDFTALFQVIKVGIQSLAAALFATIKLVDVLAKVTVYSFDAIGKALQGDFEGAGRALSQGFNSGIEQAKKDYAQLQKIFSDAPTPGTGRRTGGRGMDLDTSALDKRADAATRKAAADAKRRTTEADRAAERYNDALKEAIELAKELSQKIAGTKLQIQEVGAGPVEQIAIGFQRELNNIESEQDELIKKADEFTNKTGLMLEGLRNKIAELGVAQVGAAEAVRGQGLKELLPSLEEYDLKIAELQRGKVELTEVEKLNAQVNLLQLDILGLTNPALAEHIRLLRERAAALDGATKKQEENSNSFGTKFKQSFKQAYDAATDLGTNLASIATNGIDGLTNAIVNFAITGKASFKEFAASVLKDLSAMFLKFAIFKAIRAIFPGLTSFANGGIMTGDGPIPLKTYARGGIANSPQLAMFGEGSTPEAYVPLPDGRRIPVAMQGSGGGGTSVVVNVDATGSNVEGDGPGANQLGKVLAVAVQAELVKQQRPGGLLSGTR